MLDTAAPDTAAPTFAVLGPLEVRIAGERVGEHMAGPTGRQRDLLVWMLLHRAAGAALAATAEALWPDADRDTARREVRRYLARLSNDVPGVRAWLEPSSQALVIGLPADSVIDEAQFRADAGATRASFATGRARAASVAAQRSLARWRGDAAYPEVGHTAAGQAAAEELSALRAEIEDIALGLAVAEAPAAHRLVSQLEERVTRQPGRELAWRQLMAALVASGRSAEAWQAFARCRAALGGAMPSDATRAVEQAVLAHAPIDATLLLPPPGLPLAPPPSTRAEGPGSPLGHALRRAWTDPSRAFVAIVTPDHLPGLDTDFADAIPNEQPRIVVLEGTDGSPAAFDRVLSSVAPPGKNGAEARVAQLALASIVRGRPARAVVRTVVNAVLAASQTRPTVFVVTDAHRAAPSVRICIDELAAGPGPVLLVVAAPEPDWLPDLAPLLRRPGVVISSTA